MNHFSDKKIYAIMIQLGHDNSKKIPEVYCKICEIEMAYWNNSKSDAVTVLMTLVGLIVPPHFLFSYKIMHKTGC
jgi:hypothetical protein